MPDEPASRPPVRVLAVCTGNICRSPAIERWLAAELGDGVAVSSAGVRAVVGAPIAEPMVPLILEGGGEPEGFEARQLTEDLVREATVVLTASRAHRAAVLELVPAAVRRTFTLREFARLAALVDRAELDAATPAPAGTAARLAALVPLAARLRGQVNVDAARDDVIDPVGRPEAVFRRSAGQMLPAVAVIARVVRGS